MNDEFQYKFELLKQEMDMLQSGMRNYDGFLFTIKGWAISIFSAFIFFAADKQKPIFLGLCAISISLFWILDSLFKSIQNNYTHRYNQIEKYLQSPEFSQAVSERSFKNFSAPNISSGFKLSGRKKFAGIIHSAFQFHNYMLYLAMLILTAAMLLSFS